MVTDMEEEEIGIFDFDWEFHLDHELQELESYMFGKVTTVEEHRILQQHAGDPSHETSAQLRRIAARYQRGELGMLLPVVGPLLENQSNRQLAADFFSSIEEQPDENVLLMYRLACGWAEEVGAPIPTTAPPIDERAMDLIEVEHPWPEMSSHAIH